jgi:Tfp pilus assembly protein PilO
MKKTLFALMTIILIPTAFAKAALDEELQHKLVELDRRENQAHVDLQKAEQDALMGNIPANKLNAMRLKYEEAKEALQAELSSLPKRGEIEQWLIDNHVGVDE